jgi:hypothetical protein
VPGVTAYERVSLTLDRALLADIRARRGSRTLSATVNDLLRGALAQERLGQLVDDLDREAGPASPQAYDRVFAQWFDE